MDEWLRPSEAAEILGVHRNTLVRWTAKGEISVYRLGARGDRRYKKSDIEAYLTRVYRVADVETPGPGQKDPLERT